MNSSEYLKSYGWEEGEALKEGGLKKPILVKHKRDKKGLGSAPGGDDSEAWWERLFDGHLKNLEVTSGSKKGGLIFKQNKVVATAVSKQSSPLYQWFVKGEGLKGTIKEKETTICVEQTVVSNISRSKKRSRSDGDKEKHKHKHKKLKVSKKSKKSKDIKTNDKKSKDKKSKHKKSKDKKSKDKDHKHKRSKDKNYNEKKPKDKI
ncbi:similar to Saccharomyces cerevisiae YMR269W TMA23 Nucleolar protein implicated in ribosome biogenesis [Maudiozyma barnettii]|uniref:Similar to Saccharomyces cerevisiae YMR269W TMA23 Nucleolar protein implicated in ribosome biogenesis n=1 Tax=Maudiozyma barnettii TaxID=61262 RepID=A0A8H2VCC2_9SACH|nr:Tma23p [Kazachstania barnettii]CAB4252633.1 similar to Saccharomyces cerevisiae YMR269W TMA23 Nucleolar protein implicated in ribosome biogenesis [Kazachstania barnettii]CAD1780105.1 similar to Saccharomyces cerevisiae YMR269W TMA23 Nucleolar protein implicated in ribosome biogenesis [Kazachstania barnettii]